jgi:hypothetical protein
MPAITRVSNAAAIASVDAVVALLNVGGAGYIEIRTGTQPADVSIAATGTLLGTLPLSATAFAGAIDGVGKAVASANAITQDTSADAAGTATWFRAYSGAGTATIDGNVGLVDEALVLNNVNVALNDTLAVTAWNFEQSET